MLTVFLEWHVSSLFETLLMILSVPVNLHRLAVRAPPPPEAPVIDLDWFDFNVLFNSRTLEETRARNSDGDKRYMRPTTRPNVIEQYIAMICGHANQVRKAALPVDKRFDTNGEEIVSCKWLPDAQYDAVQSEFARVGSNRATVLSNIREAFESINVTRENFKTLDYIFMPVLKAGHYTLYGLGNYPTETFLSTVY